MFGRKKKEKKETGDLGKTASVHETTTQDGTTIKTTRQISTTSTEFRSYSREERSHSVVHSTSASNFPTFMTDKPLSIANIGSSSSLGSRLPDPIVFKSPSTPSALTSSTYKSPYFNYQPRPSLTLSSSSPFEKEFGSFPLRSRKNVLDSLQTQNRPIAPLVSSSSSSIVPTYQNTRSKLGKALIINNIKFVEKKEERLGAKKDSQDLERLLKKLGFEVELKTDMKGKDMQKKIKDFAKSNFSKFDISLVVIMSHGTNLVKKNGEERRVAGGFTQIAGTDNVTVQTEDIVECFTAEHAHATLRGQAKIFLFQCCRGDGDLEVCVDALPMKTPLKQYSDILIAHSTLPGYLSNRDPRTGTWYIQSICDVFEQHYTDHHVEDLLKIVDSNLSLKHPTYTQTSTYESRGFKKCFLHKNPI